MLYRILVATISVFVLVTSYFAASVFAWVVQGLAGMDHASAPMISIGLILGHLFCVFVSLATTFGFLKLSSTLRRALRRDNGHGGPMSN